MRSEETTGNNENSLVKQQSESETDIGIASKGKLFCELGL